MSLLNTAHAMHENISAHNAGTSSKETKTSSLLKDFFEKHRSSRIVLLLVVLLGTSMVIGDGVLTPSMSGMAHIAVKQVHNSVLIIRKTSMFPYRTVIARVVSFMVFMFSIAITVIVTLT